MASSSETHRRRRFAAAGLALAATVGATLLALGCSADQSTGGRISGEFATVYSSLPLQGPHADQAQSIINGEKLALRAAGGQAGKFKINFAVADDATAEGQSGQPGWNANRVAENARGSVENSRTIAYIGDFDSGATAISLPITNGAGIAQVSPASGAVGLTRSVEGADKGEPDKFYPSGQQTFARVVPSDDVQASAAARWAKKSGVGSVYVLGDKTLEGNGLAEEFRVAATGLGMKVVGDKTMDPRASDYRDLASEIADAKPEAVYFGGDYASNAVMLWRNLRAAMPRVQLIGSDGLLVPQFYAKVGSAGNGTMLTSKAQALSQLPAAGQRFVREYRQQFGESPDPYGAYGYASMQLVLDAIARAGDKADQRQKVVDAMVATNDLESPVGTFSIDANGDTTLDAIAGYRVNAGRARFVQALRGKHAPPLKQAQ